MKNLYKIGEYSGGLPNPKHFPTIGSDIIAIKDSPGAFSDGFLLDLSVCEVDKKTLGGKVTRTIGGDILASQLEEALASKLPLSEPEFIFDLSLSAYVVFTPEGNPVLIQVKYYQYFRNRYKECKFYKKGEEDTIVVVKVGDKVVGLCRQLFFGKESLDRIKGERI